MAGRSIKVSAEGIKLAKNALIGRRLKQQDLVGDVCYSRQPISKFLRGKLFPVKFLSKFARDWV